MASAPRGLWAIGYPRALGPDHRTHFRHERALAQCFFCRGHYMRHMYTWERIQKVKTGDILDARLHRKGPVKTGPRIQLPINKSYIRQTKSPMALARKEIYF